MQPLSKKGPARFQDKDDSQQRNFTNITTQKANKRVKREGWESRHTTDDLSRDDFLFLLSMLEGELQARDEVIAVLKSEKTDGASLRGQYGFSGPETALRALQRDSLHAHQYHLQDVFEKPTAELYNVVQVQRRSSEQMLDQLMKVSHSHRDALHKIQEQERSHRAFIHRSRCINTLLEQDRERLKLLLVKEREYQEIKEKRSSGEIACLKAELSKLKAFALLIGKEQQCLSELLEKERLHVKQLTAITDSIQQQGTALHPCTKSLHLDSEHHNQVSIPNQSQNTMSAPSLLSEVEVLRRRVVEMEGKDEELLRMWDQCRDLDHRLAQETSQCRSLRGEVDQLNGRISELDRLEEALGKSKQDCSGLRGSLERERELSKALSGELDTLKVKVTELEASEVRLEKSETVIRQDLAKLRSLTVALVEDRKMIAERLRQAEEKLNKKEGKRNEQSNLATMTERLREERQHTLKSKTDLEERIRDVVKEKDELTDRLQAEEERNKELQSKIIMMRKRLQVLENKKEKDDKYTHFSNNPHHQTEDNKVKELIQELDRLRKGLHDKEMLEEKLMKVEEDLECLGRRFRDEQKRCQALKEELEVAKQELSRYAQAEKQEVNQEHLLLCRLQKEQVKSRLLGREIESLKEKLQKLMETEASICRVQTDHSTLQRKLTLQEARNRELAREMKDLTGELDSYRQVKNLPLGSSALHFTDHQSTKEMQTEETSEPSERVEEEYDKDLNHNAQVTKRRSSLINNLNTANNNPNQYSSPSASDVDMHQTVNGEVMMLTHKRGQPLHIKVTPHHILNTATLEISSPNGDAATSYTSTAVIPTSRASPKQRITIIQNSTLSPGNTKTPPSSPDRTISPFNGTPVSRVLSPSALHSVTPDRNNSPIQIVTVRACSPEPTEVANHGVFCKTPDRQNSWQHQKANSIDSSPSVITTEDNKIHIHLGSPCIQPLSGVTHNIPQPGGPYYLRHEQRTQVLANGCHVKGVGKITSSITISPDSSSASHSSNITLSGLCD